MIRTLPSLLLMCFATLGHAAGRHAVQPCRVDEPVPAKLAHDERGAPLKIDKCYRYADATGDYALYLLDSEDRVYGKETMSSSLAAQLFLKQPDGTLVEQWAMHDRIGKGEAGAWFATKLLEFGNFDGNGAITPVLVYRFYAFDDHAASATPDHDGFKGRMKIVLFRGNRTKVAIRSITGNLDDERSTIATDSFFEMPRPQQLHLTHMMASIYERGIFGFDNSDDFYPRREKSH